MSIRSILRPRSAPTSSAPVAAPAGAGEPAVDLTDGAAVIAEAERLEADGDAVAAIDLLTRANRLERDARFERRLVGLRHRAFDALAPGGGRAEWPPTYPDPFPDVRGVPPEVSADDLTAEVLGGAIVNHGCLLVRGLVPADRRAVLIDGIDRAFDGYDAWAGGAEPRETGPWFVPFSPLKTYPLGKGRPWVRAGGGVYTIDSPRVLFDLVETFEASGVGAAIGGYMGERPAISVKKSTLRRVPLDTGTDWHQDGEFIGPDVRSVNVWVSLTDCGVDAPGLDLVPRRVDHLLDAGTEGAQFGWSIGQPVVDRAAGDTPVVRPEFHAGDALLFDDVFVHRTAIGPEMTKIRYAIESWFFAPSHYPVSQVPILY